MDLLAGTAGSNPARRATAPPPPSPSGSQEGQGRALVAVSAARSSEPARYHYYGANAAFLTHLIATDIGVPQTRTRRKEEPEPSAKAYAATAGSTFLLKPGSILNRSA
ncbi:hypothetical protein [Breoghania sp.]|uniref:hypothetical protein n=1 Tax=Breoghania sp. TaxID=2065378 RepID=UPI00262C5961|nr:hypothetical protein [Breoghania sp.]MDJ0930461.1 hypothetical protein [Breoghania sp.]